MCPPSARQTFQALNEDLGIKSPLWSVSRGTKETCSGRRPRLVRTWLAVAATPSVAGGRAASALGGDVTGTGATRRHAADPQASEPQKARGVPCLPEAERVRSVPHGKRKMEWRRGATAESEQLLRREPPRGVRPPHAAPVGSTKPPGRRGPAGKTGRAGAEGAATPPPRGSRLSSTHSFFFCQDRTSLQNSRETSKKY